MNFRRLLYRSNFGTSPRLSEAQRTALLLLLAASVAVLIGPTQANQATSPSLVIAAAQNAITHSGRASQVKSLILTGVHRDVDLDDRGTLRPATPFEVRLLLPDSYLEVSRYEFAVLKWGTYAGVPVNSIRPLKAGMMTTAGEASQQGVVEEAQLALACLSLGALATTRTVLALSPVALASCGGRCTDVSLNGRSGIVVHLQLDSATRLPLRVLYEGKVIFPRSRSVTGDARRPPPSPLPAAELAPISLSLEDRRNVGGVELPFVIRKTSRGVLLREIRLEKIVVNPSLAAGDFK